LIWEFSWSKTKNLNTVVETKMSGVEILKMFESLICIFKAFGVLLLHFKVEKFNRGGGVIFQKNLSRRPQWVDRVTGTTPIFWGGGLMVDLI
jgi:hypothetical protein